MAGTVVDTTVKGARVLVGGGAALFVGIPVAVAAASLGFLAVHGFRGLKVGYNTLGFLNKIKTDSEFTPTAYGQKLATPLKSTYNNYQAFVKAATGIDVLPEWTGQDHNPHSLDPLYDMEEKTNYDFELSRGLKQAKNVVIDFVNSGGMTYPMKLESGSSADSYLSTRTKTMTDIANHVASKTSGTTSPIPTETKELHAATEALTDFQHYISLGLEMDPSQGVEYFQKLHNTIESELTKQLEADKTAVETLCGADLPLKNDMLKTLTESHDKQLKELNEKITADKIKLQEAARKENERIFFLSHVIRQNPDLKPVFEQLSADAKVKRASTAASSTVSATISPDATISFYGIDPAKISSFKAFGAEIKRGDNGEYTMALPCTLFFRDMGDLEDKTKQRITMLVKAIKANSGREKIELFVKHNDPVHALYLARKMFEACREEGYLEANIEIKVNGKVVPLLSAANTVDKDGKEVKGEQGLVRNETEKEAIDKKAATFDTVRQNNFSQLKANVQANRTDNKTMKELIDEEKASRPTHSSP